MLMDHNGEDGDLIPSINVTVSDGPRFGQLKHKTNPVGGIRAFKVVDLQQNNIDYVFTNRSVITYYDNFTFLFQYGISARVRVQLHVCINPIPIPIVHIGKVSVGLGGVVNLGTTHLFTRDTRGGMNDTLIYHILTPPTNGSIINITSMSNEHVTTFTQTDINKENLIYNNTPSIMSSTSLTDSLVFNVCTSFQCSPPHVLNISVNSVNLTVHNTGFSVKEGGTHIITLSELDIFPPQGSFNSRFIVTRNATHGHLTLNQVYVTIYNPQRFSPYDIQTNYVSYVNFGEEHEQDCFEFLAIADYIDTEPGTENTRPPLKLSGVVNITIEPVNDHKPEYIHRKNEIGAIKDGSTLISPEDFSAHDYDRDMNDSDILWQLYADTPLSGYIYIDSDPGDKRLGITSWTEGELRARRVFYRHTGPGDTRDTLFYYITDGQLEGNRKQTFIQISLLILAPKARFDRFEVTEGESAVISTDYLSYCASNDQTLIDSDFHYTILSLPTHGRLRLNGSNVRVGTTFTQEALVSGLLEYIHNHDNSQEDGFNFNLTVPIRNNITERHFFSIHVRPIDDDPPNVRLQQDPMFVIELHKVLINNSTLVIEDHDVDALPGDIEVDRIKCTVGRRPMNGLLIKERLGEQKINPATFTKYDVINNSLYYNHTILGDSEDSFTFTVSDGINTLDQIIEVRIVILPNEIEIEAESISLDENQLVYFHKDEFIVHHPYLSTVPGQFNITKKPSNGAIKKHNEEINFFTTMDMEAESIVYTHNGGESKHDYFTFIYESLYPDNYHRYSAPQNVSIYINPVDDQPPIFASNRTELSIISGETVVLNRRHLNLSDGDTLPTQLVYSFTLSINGFIAFVGAEHQSISAFTQDDVNNERVVFVAQADINGAIRFNVTDSTQYAIAELVINVRTITLTCDMSNWEPVSVMAGSSTVLTANNIKCEIIDLISREITYTITSHVAHGNITVNGRSTNTFTMTNVSRGIMSYVHTDFEFWSEEENISIKATSPLVKTVYFDLVIQIRHQYSNSSSLAAHDVLRLAEGGQTCYNEDGLDARNIRYESWLQIQNDNNISDTVKSELVSPSKLVVVFNISQLPVNGVLLINGTALTQLPASFTNYDIANRMLCYNHSGSETVQDIFHFNLYTKDHFGISNHIHQTTEEQLRIEITPVNDEVPVVENLNMLELVENFTMTITNDSLLAVDKDSSARNISYTFVTELSNIKLWLREEELHNGSNFTQTDIDNELLMIRPMTTHNGSLGFKVKDENVNHSFLDIVLLYTVAEHSLILVDREGTIIKNGTEILITYCQNETKITLTNLYLNAITNGDTKDTVYVVDQSPRYGSLTVDDSRFSQLDVDQGLVEYIHDVSKNNGSADDFIKLTITNRRLTNRKYIVHLTSLAMGSVKKEVLINLSSILSQPLPSDLLQLNELEKDISRPPEILVINRSTYGNLKMVPGEGTEKHHHKHSTFSFLYDDLKQNWIYYMWTYDSPINTSSINSDGSLDDNFTVLVLATGKQPGKAVVHLKIIPPSDYHPSVMTSPTEQTVSQSHTTNVKSDSGMVSDSGFPLYTLVPILGVLILLIILIVIVIIFCLTQQKRIRKKWQPNLSTRRSPVHSYPWSHPLQQQPLPTHNYNFNPPVGAEESEDEGTDNSETSSGFSEPLGSPRHSPVQAYHRSRQNSEQPQSTSPSGYDSNMNRISPSQVPSRSRIRSNVSVTYTSRQSVMSDLSVEDPIPHYTGSLPKFQINSMVAPTPVRQGTQSAFSRVDCRNIQSTTNSRKSVAVLGAGTESGYDSCRLYWSTEDSGIPSRAESRTEECDEEEEEVTAFPSADINLSLSVSNVHDMSNKETVSNDPQPMCSEESMTNPESIKLKKSNLDLNGEGEDEFVMDPNVLHMLSRPPNPVLKKEEYWV